VTRQKKNQSKNFFSFDDLQEEKRKGKKRKKNGQRKRKVYLFI